MRATIVDLRYHMKEVLGAIDRGETVTVLHGGKEKATLTPISSSPRTDVRCPSTVEQPLFGLWSDRGDVADPDSYVRNLRQKRPLSMHFTTQRRSGRKQRK